MLGVIGCLHHKGDTIEVEIQRFLPSIPSGSLPVHFTSSWEAGRVGAVTSFTLHESHPRAIGVRKIRFSASNTLTRRHLLHTPSSLSIFHRHAHANGKLQTKGPWATPSQVSWSLGKSIYPTDGSTLSLGSRGKELAPRGKNETTHHHATMATHPSLLANC